jgi:hypothetical protein
MFLHFDQHDSFFDLWMDFDGLLYNLVPGVKSAHTILSSVYTPAVACLVVLGLCSGAAILCSGSFFSFL